MVIKHRQAGVKRKSKAASGYRTLEKTGVKNEKRNKRKERKGKVWKGKRKEMEVERESRVTNSKGCDT
jgi:hypothetical protein